jgi:hypothetical protein
LSLVKTAGRGSNLACFPPDLGGDAQPEEQMTVPWSALQFGSMTGQQVRAQALDGIAVQPLRPVGHD